VKYAYPIIAFCALAVFLAVGLHRDPRLLPSPLIDRMAPDFQLSQLDEPGRMFSPNEMRGKVWLLNTWASWCVSCQQEHPLLLALARSGAIPIYGFNYKDKRGDALDWLKTMGNPYVLNVQDSNGRVGMDYGVYGVPETYLIDKAGVIRFKQIGPITLESLEQKIMPLIRSLNS